MLAMVGSPYPLTAPAVRPATIRRWKISTMMMIGTVTTTAAAAIWPVGSWNCDPPVKNASVAGTVRAAFVEVSVLAKRKSFHAKMNTRMAVVNTPGAASGAITFVNAWNGVAPSTWAACSSSHGISLKNADSVYIASGSVNVIYGMISPAQVSNRPTFRHRLNSEPTIEIGGNIATASEPDRMIVFPAKSSRDSAYAAIDASTTAISVAISAMPIELISARLNSSVWNSVL